MDLAPVSTTLSPGNRDHAVRGSRVARLDGRAIAKNLHGELTELRMFLKSDRDHVAASAETCWNNAIDGLAVSSLPISLPLEKTT
jgi:hypothetical protein